MSPTRNPESSFSLEDQASPMPSGAAPAPVASRTRPVKRGVFVPITESGKLDVDRISKPDEIERARAALGVVDPATLPPPEVKKINKNFIVPAYSLLEVIIRLVGSKALHWPDELVVEMYMDPKKKEALVEPTAEVLQRYAPSWLIENQDIAALGACLGDAIDDMVNGGVRRWTAKKNGQPLPVPPPVQTRPVAPPIQREFTPVMPVNGMPVAA